MVGVVWICSVQNWAVFDRDRDCFADVRYGFRIVRSYPDID